MAAIETPCINICQIDPSGDYCLGCQRSLDEIAQWSTLSAEARRAIMAQLPQREKLRQDL